VESADCVEYASVCLPACEEAADPVTCVADCDAAHPDGSMLYETVSGCARCEACAIACDAENTCEDAIAQP
jgi:hypothetical protein